MLRRAVSCFLRQTYQPRELVIIHQSDDQPTREYLATLSEPMIRTVEVPGSPRLTIGALRNISMEAAHGHYIAVWDDDDWHAPTRLDEQIKAIDSTGRQGCVLSLVTLYDELTGSAFLSARRLWEASLLAERTAVPAYPDLRRGSDTPVIASMAAESKLVGLDRPDLYVYFYHGENVWNRAHWEQNLLPHASPLTEPDTERIRSLFRSMN